MYLKDSVRAIKNQLKFSKELGKPFSFMIKRADNFKSVRDFEKEVTRALASEFTEKDEDYYGLENLKLKIVKRKEYFALYVSYSFTGEYVYEPIVLGNKKGYVM